MDYVFISTIPLFILITRNSERFHPTIAAGMLVGIPLVLNSITRYIGYGFKDMIAMTVNTQSLVTLVVQFGVLCYIFYKITQSENDLTTYFGWVMIGWPFIFLFVPWLVNVAV